MNLGELTRKVLALFGVKYERMYWVANIGKRREKQMYEALHVSSGVENDSEWDDVYTELIFGTIHELSAECV
jgi:hypothetical protein